MRRLGVRNRMGIALIALLLATIGMAPGLSPAPASAQDDEVTAAAIVPGTNAVVANGPLNQRSTASTSGSILQVLSTGTIVAVISGPTAANGYSWWYVTANAINGYVAGEFLAEVGFVVGDSVTINSNNVNIRSGPGTGSPVIDQLDNGAAAEVIGGPSSASGYVWYQIQYGTSSTGWVAGIYLSISNVPSGQFGVGSWIFVDDPPVNLRSGPGTGFSVIGSLANNIGVQVTGTPTSANGFTWYPVTTLAAVNGYVAGEYFTGGIYLGDYGMVTDGPLNLRSTASTSGNILASMPNNASLFVNSVTPVTASGYTWLNVTYNGITGWAVGGYMGPA